MPKAKRWSLSDVEVCRGGKVVAKKKARTSDKIDTTGLKESRTGGLNFSRGGWTGVMLGVDPSLRGTGLAVVQFKAGHPTLLFSQVIKTKGDMPEALGQIAQSVRHVCEQFHPDAATLESTIFAQNHRTAITLGASRGAAIAVLALYGIPCSDLAPTRIKQAVVGVGSASKVQVARMVQALLKLPAALGFDESDAAAAAMAGARAK